MLVDGDDPNRAYVEDVPVQRQADARRDINETMTGNPYNASRRKSKPRAVASSSPISTPASSRRRNGKRTAGSDATEGAAGSRRKSRRRRLSQTSRGRRGAGPAALYETADASWTPPSLVADDDGSGDDRDDDRDDPLRSEGEMEQDVSDVAEEAVEDLLGALRGSAGDE